MVALNRVTLIGHLGKDPEAKTIGDSKLVTFSMAITDAWTRSRVRRTRGGNAMAQHSDLECRPCRGCDGLPEEGFPRLR